MPPSPLVGWNGVGSVGEATSSTDTTAAATTTTTAASTSCTSTHKGVSSPHFRQFFISMFLCLGLGFA